jgi:hypothetical protein
MIDKEELVDFLFWVQNEEDFRFKWCYGFISNRAIADLYFDHKLKENKQNAETSK